MSTTTTWDDAAKASAKAQKGFAPEYRTARRFKRDVPEPIDEGDRIKIACDAIAIRDAAEAKDEQRKEVNGAARKEVVDMHARARALDEAVRTGLTQVEHDVEERIFLGERVARVVSLVDGRLVEERTLEAVELEREEKLDAANRQGTLDEAMRKADSEAPAKSDGKSALAWVGRLCGSVSSEPAHLGQKGDSTPCPECQLEGCFAVLTTDRPRGDEDEPDAGDDLPDEPAPKKSAKAKTPKKKPARR